MTLPLQTQDTEAMTLTSAIDKACRAIPPVWPLASSVAVNPYLGRRRKASPPSARGSGASAARR